jgi:hypothetical protein
VVNGDAREYGSAGGACAGGARFGHCFLFDPWIGGFACPLAAEEMAARRVSRALRTMRVWLNEGSLMAQLSNAGAEALVGKAKAAGARTADVIDVAASSHYAQTDVPTVFEHGPLSCLYGLIKGRAPPPKEAGMLSAKQALRSCIGEALEPLLEDQWLAVGLAPLGG